MNQDEFSVWDAACFQGRLYVSFREFQLSVGNQQAVTKRQALEAPAWFGSRTFHGCPAIKKTMGIFKRRMLLENFWKVTFPPKKTRKTTVYITFCCPWWRRKTPKSPGATISTRRAFCKGCLGIATNGAGGENRGYPGFKHRGKDPMNTNEFTGKLQASKIHGVDWVPGKLISRP